MKRIALLVLGVMAISPTALAQTDAIDKALLAAPASLRDGATVIRWKSDFTYDTLKKGTNRLVCFDLSGLPEQPSFMIECTSIGNLDRVAQNRKLEASGDKSKTKVLFDAAEKNGTRVKPEYGSVWYHLMGPDREHAQKRTVVDIPGATTQSTGLPDNPEQGGAWIVNAGTANAYLMIPGEEGTEAGSSKPSK